MEGVEESELLSERIKEKFAIRREIRVKRQKERDWDSVKKLSFSS